MRATAASLVCSPFTLSRPAAHTCLFSQRKKYTRLPHTAMRYAGVDVS